jgi:hypothetical protein
MKKIFTPILLFISYCSFSQCETSAQGAVSLHLTRGAQTGYGGEMGFQGIDNRFSGFLGLDVTPVNGFKGKDSTVSLVYVKGLYRFYQNPAEDLYLAGVMAPAFLNTDFEFLSGLRLLYVTGRVTAVSVEPLWYVNQKQLHVNLNLHFLL